MPTGDERHRRGGTSSPSRRSAAPPAEPPLLLKLSTPADIVEAVPHLLGFHPAESLVAVGLQGPRRRLGLKLRVDLPAPDDEEALAQLVTAHLAHAGVDGALLVVYSEQVAERGLARVSLVETVRSVLEARGLQLCDALLVQGGRWRSYSCTSAACCPLDGVPLRTSAQSPSRVAAALAYAGLAALPSREHLERSLRAPRSVARVGAEQALDRVAAALVARLGAGTTPLTLRDEARDLLHTLLARYADGCPSLAPDDAARLILALRDVPLRDEVCAMFGGRYADELRSLLTDLVRRAVPPDDAPVVTVLAAVAYAQGDGTVAGIALERALASDPGYSLAGLLMEGLERGVHPDALRQVWSGAGSRRRRTGGRRGGRRGEIAGLRGGDERARRRDP